MRIDGMDVCNICRPSILVSSRGPCRAEGSTSKHYPPGAGWIWLAHPTDTRPWDSIDIHSDDECATSGEDIYLLHLDELSLPSSIFHLHLHR